MGEAYPSLSPADLNPHPPNNAAVQVAGCEGITVTGFIAEETARVVINDASPNDAFSTLQIVNFDFDNGNLFVPANSSIALYHASDVIIADGIILQNAGQQQILLTSCNNVRITNVDFAQAQKITYCIYLSSSNYTTISGCQFPGNPAPPSTPYLQQAAYFVNSSFSIISNCQFGSLAQAVQLDATSNFNRVGNNFYNLPSWNKDFGSGNIVGESIGFKMVATAPSGGVSEFTPTPLLNVAACALGQAPVGISLAFYVAPSPPSPPASANVVAWYDYSTTLANWDSQNHPYLYFLVVTLGAVFASGSKYPLTVRVGP